MSNRWNHVICDPCFKERERSRPAVRHEKAPKEPCCVCGTETTSGLFVRANPAEMKCKGEGPAHPVESDSE